MTRKTLFKIMKKFTIIIISCLLIMIGCNDKQSIEGTWCFQDDKLDSIYFEAFFDSNNMWTYSILTGIIGPLRYKFLCDSLLLIRKDTFEFNYFKDSFMIKNKKNEFKEVYYRIYKKLHLQLNEVRTIEQMEEYKNYYFERSKSN